MASSLQNIILLHDFLQRALVGHVSLVYRFKRNKFGSESIDSQVDFTKSTLAYDFSNLVVVYLGFEHSVGYVHENVVHNQFPGSQLPSISIDLGNDCRWSSLFSVIRRDRLLAHLADTAFPASIAFMNFKLTRICLQVILLLVTYFLQQLGLGISVFGLNLVQIRLVLQIYLLLLRYR